MPPRSRTAAALALEVSNARTLSKELLLSPTREAVDFDRFATVELRN
jgi:hypothetical protein